MRVGSTALGFLYIYRVTIVHVPLDSMVLEAALGLLLGGGGRSRELLDSLLQGFFIDLVPIKLLSMRPLAVATAVDPTRLAFFIPGPKGPSGDALLAARAATRSTE